MAIELRSSLMPASCHASLAAHPSRQRPAVAGEKILIGCRPVEVTIGVLVRQIPFTAASLCQAAMKGHRLARHVQPRAFEADPHEQGCVPLTRGYDPVESSKASYGAAAKQRHRGDTGAAFEHPERRTIGQAAAILGFAAPAVGVD